ncbi:hypothetical protein EVAR_64433_1 [Eumeta japonica]|uniref:Uncharacterized protein n=1 Tax=Eumeta variegata TaxID=151549 RepID=A0A4C1ZJD8_EUMVA|nr:hypothetical protein EVAR_64433_1 [Eumeta japonica]
MLLEARGGRPPGKTLLRNPTSWPTAGRCLLADVLTDAIPKNLVQLTLASEVWDGWRQSAPPCWRAGRRQNLRVVRGRPKSLVCEYLSSAYCHAKTTDAISCPERQCVPQLTAGHIFPRVRCSSSPVPSERVAAQPPTAPIAVPIRSMRVVSEVKAANLFLDAARSYIPSTARAGRY